MRRLKGTLLEMVRRKLHLQVRCSSCGHVAVLHPHDISPRCKEGSLTIVSKIKWRCTKCDAQLVRLTFVQGEQSAF